MQDKLNKDTLDDKAADTRAEEMTEQFEVAFLRRNPQASPLAKFERAMVKTAYFYELQGFLEGDDA